MGLDDRCVITLKLYGQYVNLLTEEFILNNMGKENIGNSPSNVLYKQLPQDDPQQRCPDITLAKAQLNWQPSISLDEGLRGTVEYFRALLAQSDPKTG